MTSPLQTPERTRHLVANGWWRVNRTFLDDFLAHAQTHPAKAAVVSYESEGTSRVELSYGELLDRVDRCALGLLRLGVVPGDVVSLQLPNWWQFPVISYACHRIGAVVNPLLPIFRRRELGFALEALKSRVCFAPVTYRGFDHAATISELSGEYAEKRTVVAIGEGARPGDILSFEELLTTEPPAGVSKEALDLLRPLPDQVAEVQFTSGTTGAPKGVVHTYNTLYASYRAIRDELELRATDVIHVPSTMAHQTGYLNGCLMALSEGMTAVYQDHWDPGKMVSIVATEGVTYTSGATPFMIDFCDAAERASVDLSSLRYFRSGGSAVPPVVSKRMHEVVGAEVVTCWGMTENGVCTITAKDASPQEVASSDGRPLPWVSLKVTDPAGRELPPGMIGLLWVRTASQCIDYVPDHSLYAQAFDGEWFNTGDLARLAPDGSLRITGRVKDMIIRGGENVPVLEVEHALLAMDEVAEVALVAIPDERLGERACAVVVLSDDFASLSLESVKWHLARANMAKQYWPELLLITSALPRNSAGKLQKQLIRALAVRELGSLPESAHAPSTTPEGANTAAPSPR